MWWREFDGGRRSLWREMDRMRREMDRVARAGLFTPAPAYPALNVWSNADGLVITAEIPGIEPADVEISIVGETLTIAGERKPDEVDGERRYHRRERGCGRFVRTLQLPYRIENQAIEATFDKGVLTIILPRAEEDKPKKIQVKVA
jgi:HSP20 family protein